VARRSSTVRRQAAERGGGRGGSTLPFYGFCAHLPPRPPADKKFKLYLQTKLPNPHYRPEIQAQCTLVNFIATESGLQDQLLARVVNEEKAELEKRKQELAEAFNLYKMQLLGLEDDLVGGLDDLGDIHDRIDAAQIEERYRSGGLAQRLLSALLEDADHPDAATLAHQLIEEVSRA
jgi:GNAT superfamily N-acetyltransferase